MAHNCFCHIHILCCWVGERLRYAFSSGIRPHTKSKCKDTGNQGLESCGESHEFCALEYHLAIIKVDGDLRGRYATIDKLPVSIIEVEGHYKKLKSCLVKLIAPEGIVNQQSQFQPATHIAREALAADKIGLR